MKTQPDVGIAECESPHGTPIVLQVSPNPFTHRTQIRYRIYDAGYTIKQGNQGTRASVGGMSEYQQPEFKIYDATGRLVKSFSLPTTHCLLPTVISWSGVDDADRRLPSGIYFLVLQTESNIARGKVLLMR